MRPRKNPAGASWKKHFLLAGYFDVLVVGTRGAFVVTMEDNTFDDVDAAGWDIDGGAVSGPD